MITGKGKTGMCRSCSQTNPNAQYKQKYYCKICGKIICHNSYHYGSGLCSSCNAKSRNGKNNGHYKGNKAKVRQKYKCKKCGKKIHYNTALYRSGVCGSCSRIGKKANKQTKEKQSKAQIKRFQNLKEREKIRQANLGKKHTKATRKKIGIGNTGKKHTQKTKDKISIANSGKNSGLYIHGNGHLPYTKEFTPSLKEQIRQRDNFTCQCCGFTQEEHYKKWGKDIEVHHIDHCPYNCDKNNLITLCKECNMKANYNIDYWFAYYTYIMENRTWKGGIK